MLIQFTVATHNHYNHFKEIYFTEYSLTVDKTQFRVQWFNFMINVYFTNTYLSIGFALKCIFIHYAKLV